MCECEVGVPLPEGGADEEAALAPLSIDTTLERAFSKSSLEIPAANAFSSADCCAEVKLLAEVGLSSPFNAELIAACLALEEDEGVEVEEAFALAALMLIAEGVADFLPLFLVVVVEDEDPPRSNEEESRSPPPVVEVLPLLILRV